MYYEKTMPTARAVDRTTESFTGANNEPHNHSTHGVGNWRERSNSRPMRMTRRAVAGNYAAKLGA